MWLVGFTLFFGFKLLTLLRLDAACLERFSAGSLAGYLLLWPGFRPQPFLYDPGCEKLSSRFLWVNGCLQLAAGCMAIWGIPRWLPVRTPAWLFAWVGMVGFSLCLHFGLFDLLAAFWRSRGIPVEKLFSNPWRSASLTDFWSNRWNRSFSGLARDFLFWPLARRWGARWATLAVFVFSGLIHELMISFPARGGYGGPFLYFLINAVAVLIENLSGWRRWAQRLPMLSRAWALTVVIGPLPFLFHSSFQAEVVIPFLKVLGMSNSIAHF
jgi:alginate O-acetyltransferase complex protein AlgI